MTTGHESHTSGLLYFMPGWIFEHPNLSQTEKMIYALLSGLAHGNEAKTCFPSDEYIGKRVGIRKGGANEAVAKLCKVGAISKEVVSHEKNPFKKKRIITVYLCPQKSFTNTEKPEPRGNEKPEPPYTEKPERSNKGNRNKEESSLKGAKESAANPKPSARIPRAAHVFSSFEEHEKLVQEFGEEMVQRAYQKLSEWKSDTPKSKWKKNDHLAIRRWVIESLREQDIKAEKASKTPENRIKEVHRYIVNHPKKEVLKRAVNANMIKLEKTHLVRLGQIGGDATLNYTSNGIFDQIDSLIGKLEGRLMKQAPRKL